MDPLFNPYDKLMFYEYLDNATNYFEFGSGGSTYKASLRKNIQHIVSVESDLSWHHALKDQLNYTDNIDFIFCYMNVIHNTYGHPGPLCTPKQRANYSEKIVVIGDDAKLVDLLLIDGRFRVACALKAFNVISDNCRVVFDDFLNRPAYHVVLDF